MLDIEFLNKYFLTAFDFLFRYPRKFYERRSENQSQYMSPIGFFVTTFVLYETALAGTIQILNKYWDWNYVLGISIKLPDDLDLPMIMAINGTTSLFITLLISGLVKISVFLTRKHISFENVLISICYASAFNIIAIAYFGFMIVSAFIVGNIPVSHPELINVNNLGRYLYTGFQNFTILGLGYLIASIAAVSRLHFVRILIGFFLVIILFVIIIITSEIVFSVVSS